MTASSNNTADIAARGFNDAEYAERMRRIQHAMGRANVDVLLLTTEPEFRYFSGFFTQFWQSPTRPWFLLIPANGDAVAVIPAIGEVCMRKTRVADIRTWSSPHPTDDGVTLLVDSLRELLGDSGTIGLLKGSETHLRMPLNDYERVLAKLDGYRFQDATHLVRAQRHIKSAAEVAKIESACRAAGRAFADLPNLVQAGMTEIELFRQFKRSCLAAGADDVSYLVGASAAGGYNDIIAPPSQRQLTSGDVLILDTGCVYDGYFCDFDRNYALGAADAESRSAYARVHDALEAALQAAAPGVQCCELFEIMQTVLQETGSVGRLGHGLGMQLTETPSITAFDTTVLEAGMVMTLEPGLSYGDGRLMVHEENIVIEAEGARLLTSRASPTLPVIAV